MRDPDPAVLSATGTVISAQGAFARIAVDGQPTCQACAQQAGCGLGPLLTMFGANRARVLDVPNSRPEPLQAGDRVRVSLRGRRLAAFAALAYGMPLAGLLGGAVLATVWMPGAGDGVAVIGALAGAGAAGLLISLDVVRRSTVAALPAVVQRIE